MDEANGARVAFLEPNGYVFTLGHEKRINHAVGHTLIRAHNKAIERYGDRPLVGIIDWSTMAGYDSDTRAELTEWGKSINHQIAACCMIPPPMNIVAKMGLQVAGTALRVMGIRFEFYDSVEAAIAAFHLQQPADRSAGT